MPCPRCGAAPEPAPARHRFSKTFEFRWKPFKYKPETALEEINSWLDEQPGLINISAKMHLRPGPQLSGFTFDCVGSDERSPYRARFDRLSLIPGRLRVKRLNLSDELNRWDKKFPERRRISYWTINIAGKPVDLWLLYAERVEPLRLVDVADEPESSDEQRGGYL